jgi:hypothetical protein
MKLMARKNRIYFQNGTPRSVKTIEIQIIHSVIFWCKNCDESLPADVQIMLSQGVQTLQL